MARDFNGTSDVLVTPTDVILRPPLPVSVSAWVWADTITGSKGIWHNNKTDSNHRGVWFIVSAASGAMELSYGDGAGSLASDRRSKVSTGVIIPGRWHHVGGVCRGAGDMDIFIDGRDAAGTYSGSGGALGYQVTNGQIGSVSGGNFWDGRIAHVAVWTAALEEDEMLRMAQGLSPRLVRPASLLTYWPLTELRDVWINHLDATDATATDIAGGPDLDFPIGAMFGAATQSDDLIEAPFIDSTTVLFDQQMDSPVFPIPLLLRWSQN